IWQQAGTPGSGHWASEGNNSPPVQLSTSTHIWIHHDGWYSGNAQTDLESLDVGDFILVYNSPSAAPGWIEFYCVITSVITHGSNYVEFGITWLDGDTSPGTNGNDYGYPQRISAFHPGEGLAELH